MKRSGKFILCFLFLSIVCVLSFQSAEAKKDPKKTPPGQAKKKTTPPGLSKKQGLPPGIAKKQGISMTYIQKHQQAWCLEHQGQVNFVLPDEAICDCLTKTHAVAFASEDNWTEAIGKSLHHALTTDREPGIVVVIEQDEDQSHVSQLSAVIEHFSLPIILWHMEIEEQEKETE